MVRQETRSEEPLWGLAVRVGQRLVATKSGTRDSTGISMQNQMIGDIQRGERSRKDIGPVFLESQFHCTERTSSLRLL